MASSAQAKEYTVGDASKESTMSTSPVIIDVPLKESTAEDSNMEISRPQERPTTPEIIVWYIYDLCTYSIQTVLLPIVFPIIISQTVAPSQPLDDHGWTRNSRGLSCRSQEMQLYKALTHHSVRVGHLNFSPLIWTAISWAIGIFFSGPILANVHLDHDQMQPFISAAATVVGAIFCLPVGFIKSKWVFLPYIVIISIAIIIATAAHTRHLGLMICGYTGPAISKRHFPVRQAFSSSLSLYATAAGTVSAAIFAAFAYHMLHYGNKFVSLWVVSIFIGLKWLIAICHALGGNRLGIGGPPLSSAHAVTVFKYPQAIICLASILLSSFTSTCIFTSGMLWIVGELCFKPIFLLSLWLIHFISPLFFLPHLHLLQQIIRADAVRMQLLGFFISATISGIGFYFRQSNWRVLHVLLASAFHGTATAVFHAFGRVLVLDHTPSDREGAFSIWYVWLKALGSCAGLALGSLYHSHIKMSLDIAFWTAVLGIIILVFGNISSLDGAVMAGHVRENVD